MPTNVSSAEFIRNIGYWQNEALRHPVSITHHGRERLVLAAPEAFQVTTPSPESSRSLATLRADMAAILENLADGYLVFDAQLCVRGSNAAIETFLGVSKDDLRGAPVLHALPKPLASVLADRVQRAMRVRRCERFEIGLPEGRFLSVSVFPTTIGAAALLQNITEQHALRRRLDDCEATQQAVHKHPCMTVIKLDVRGRIEKADETLKSWSGHSAADVIGRRIIDLVAEDQRLEVADLIERVLHERETRQIALRLLGEGGAEIAGVLVLSPIMTDVAAQGAIACIVRSVEPVQPVVR